MNKDKDKEKLYDDVLNSLVAVYGSKDLAEYTNAAISLGASLNALEEANKRELMNIYNEYYSKE